MIITEINGGLGNQLFQYAAGLSLALRHQTDLKISVQFKAGDTQRTLGLSHFVLDLTTATSEDIKTCLPVNFLDKIYQRLVPARHKKLFKEKHFAYNSNFEQLGDTVYLKGYWQTANYFSGCEDHIRKAFQLNPVYYERVIPFLTILSQSDSVAIHVRKGDYLLPPYSDYYAQLKVDYYQHAINLLKETQSDINLFVFTDDPAWVEKYLKLNESFTVVSGNETTTMYEDFQAMRSCKHHIIANSSFSWWTAWLSNRAGKQIIAPKQWFNQGPSDTQDLLPKSWHIV